MDAALARPLLGCRHRSALVNSELVAVMSLMRTNARWAVVSMYGNHASSPDVDGLGEDPLLRDFQVVRRKLHEAGSSEEAWANTAPREYLAPFLEVVRSVETSGPITGMALSAIHKVLLCEVFTPDAQGAAAAMHAVADAVTHCRFEATDPASDEVVLSKILQVLVACVRSPCGSLLSDEDICAIVQACFRIGHQTGKESELLQRLARQALLDVVRATFGRMESWPVDDAASPLASTSSQLNEDAPPPFGSASLAEVLRFLATLVALEDGPDTEVMNVFGLTLINAALESAGSALGRHPEVLALCKGDVCRAVLKAAGTGHPSAGVLSCACSVIHSLYLYLREATYTQLEQLLSRVVLRNARGGATYAAGASAGTMSPKPGSAGAPAPAAPQSLPATPPGGNAEQMRMALECLVDLVALPGFLLDAYANFDCAVGRVDIFEETISLFSKTVFPTSVGGVLGPLHVSALEGVLASLDEVGRGAESATAGAAVPSLDAGAADTDSTSAAAAPAPESVGDDGSTPAAAAAAASDALDAAIAKLPADTPTAWFDVWSCERVIAAPESTDGESAAAEVRTHVLADALGADLPPEPPLERLFTYIHLRKSIKRRLVLAASHFNRDAKKGLQFLAHARMLPPLEGGGDALATAVARFLRYAPNLDKTAIGEILGEDPKKDKNAIATLTRFTDLFDFTGMRFDNALRLFLGSFRLPGEAQKISRIMEVFAARYHACVTAGNAVLRAAGGEGELYESDADSYYVLAYSVIMLNTDLHNKQVKKKMTLEQFLKNNRGTNQGGDWPESFLTDIYETISRDEIKIETAAGGGSEPAAGGAPEEPRLEAPFPFPQLPYPPTELPAPSAGWSDLGHLPEAERRAAVVRAYHAAYERRNAAETDVHPTSDAVAVYCRYVDHLLSTYVPWSESPGHSVQLAIGGEILKNMWGPCTAALSVALEHGRDAGVLTMACEGAHRAAMAVARHRLPGGIDHVVATLCRPTAAAHPSAASPRPASVFGMDARAMRTCGAAFTVAHQYGDRLGDSGWRALLDVLLRLHRMGLVVSSVVEEAGLADGTDPSMPRAHSAPTEVVSEAAATPTPPLHSAGSSGFLRALFGGVTDTSYGAAPPPTPAEVEAERRAGDVVLNTCRVDDLLADTKFFEDESLLRLCRALVWAGGGKVVPPSVAAAALAGLSAPVSTDGDEDGGHPVPPLSVPPGHERSAAFCLDALVYIALRNRDRLGLLWASVAAHLSAAIAGASAPSPTAEKAVFGVLRVCRRLLPYKEEVALELGSSLGLVALLDAGVADQYAPRLASEALDLAVNCREHVRGARAWGALCHLLVASAHHGQAFEDGFRALLACCGTDVDTVNLASGENSTGASASTEAGGESSADAEDKPSLSLNAALLPPEAFLPVLGAAFAYSRSTSCSERVSALAVELVSALHAQLLEKMSVFQKEHLTALDRAQALAPAPPSTGFGAFFGGSSGPAEETQESRDAAEDAAALEKRLLEYYGVWFSLINDLAAKCCIDARPLVREASVIVLQRCLLGADKLYSLPSSVASDAISKVVIPLVGELTEFCRRGDGRMLHADKTLRMSITTLSKVLLQYAHRLVGSDKVTPAAAAAEGSAFPAAWLSALDALVPASKVRTEEVSEAVPEAVKNMLLVLVAQNIITQRAAKETPEAKLWELTWKQVALVAPSLKADQIM